MAWVKSFGAKVFVLLGVCFGVPSLVYAGPSDPTAAALEAAAAPGETTTRVCLPNGFIQVQFFDALANLVSAAESSTTCIFSSSTTVEQRYASAATHLILPFLDDADVRGAGNGMRVALVQLPRVPSVELDDRARCALQLKDLREKRGEVLKEQRKVEGLQRDVDGKLSDLRALLKAKETDPNVAKGRFLLDEGAFLLDLRKSITSKLEALKKTGARLDGDIARQRKVCFPEVAPKANYSVTASPGQLSGEVRFADDTQNWQHRVELNYTNLSDGRSLADRQGDLLSAAFYSTFTAQAYALSVNANVVSGQVSSDATASTLKGRYFSLGGSYLRPLVNDWFGSVGVNFTHGKNDIDIGGGTGEFSVQAVSLDGVLQKRFLWRDVDVLPELGVGARWIERESYVDSNGLNIPGDSLTQASVRSAVTLSKSLRQQTGFEYIAPGLSVGASYVAQTSLDAELPGGGVVDEPGLGGFVGLNVKAKTHAGAKLLSNVRYQFAQHDARRLQFGVSVNVPFD